jgi:hypothetical protein
MIIKILGILDIFVGMCFWVFGIFGLIPGEFIILLGLFLLCKGIVFATNLSVASILDIISSIIIIFSSSIEMPNFLIIIVSLFLLQKGIFSLLS